MEIYPRIKVDEKQQRRKEKRTPGTPGWTEENKRSLTRRIRAD